MLNDYHVWYRLVPVATISQLIAYIPNEYIIFTFIKFFSQVLAFREQRITKNNYSKWHTPKDIRFAFLQNTELG